MLFKTFAVLSLLVLFTFAEIGVFGLTFLRGENTLWWFVDTILICLATSLLISFVLNSKPQ